MQSTNPMITFLQELFLRLSTKSPKFFKVIQLVSAIAAAVTGLPGLFQELNITLPAWAVILQNKSVAWASATSLFISLLTAQSKPVSKTEDGVILKKTDETKLPFTANSEQKAADKQAEKGEELPTSLTI
jgi:hypothetical protein